MNHPRTASFASPGDARLALERARLRLLAVPAPDPAIAHRLRNHMGALSAALDVHDSSEPGSADAVEAADVAGRQAAALVELLAAVPPTQP